MVGGGKDRVAAAVGADRTVPPRWTRRARVGEALHVAQVAAAPAYTDAADNLVMGDARPTIDDLAIPEIDVSPTGMWDVLAAVERL